MIAYYGDSVTGLRFAIYFVAQLVSPKSRRSMLSTLRPTGGGS